MTLTQEKIAARVDELKRLAVRTSVAYAVFEAELLDRLRQRLLHAKPNVPGEPRAHYAALRRR